MAQRIDTRSIPEVIEAIRIAHVADGGTVALVDMAGRWGERETAALREAGGRLEEVLLSRPQSWEHGHLIAETVRESLRRGDRVIVLHAEPSQTESLAMAIAAAEAMREAALRVGNEERETWEDCLKGGSEIELHGVKNAIHDYQDAIRKLPVSAAIAKAGGAR